MVHYGCGEAACGSTRGTFRVAGGRVTCPVCQIAVVDELLGITQATAEEIMAEIGNRVRPSLDLRQEAMLIILFNGFLAKENGDQKEDRKDAKPGTTPMKQPGETIDPPHGTENGDKKK